MARSVASCVAISFGLHALVIAALLYVRVDFSKPRLPPGAISVNLVSLPGPGPAAGPAGGEGGAPAEKPKPGEAQGVVWYTGQFYALFFLQNTLKLDYQTAYLLIAAALVIGTPFFVYFGSLSDRIGRKRIMVAGCLIAALTFIPIFKGLTQSVNPALAEFQARAAVTVAGADCHFRIFAKPATPCDQARDFLTKAGVNYERIAPEPGEAVVTTIAGQRLAGFDEAAYRAALDAVDHPGAPDPARMNLPVTLLLLVILMLYVTMVYGPIAAFLVGHHAVSPYLVCVMTEGTNYVDMATAIADVSRFVYGQVDQSAPRGPQAR